MFSPILLSAPWHLVSTSAFQTQHKSNHHLRLEEPSSRRKLNQKNIPKLKLQAALMGARLCKFKTEDSRLNFNTLQLWTDSTTVLSWINSPENKSFIVRKELTKFCQLLKPNSDNIHPVNGARILLPESDWPQPKLQVVTVFQPIFATKDKEKTTPLTFDSTILHTNAIVKRADISRSAKKEPIIDVSRFSDWLRLVRATAHVIQLKNILQQKTNRNLRIADREMGKTLLYEQSQRATFTDNIKRFNYKQSIGQQKCFTAVLTFHGWYSYSCARTTEAITKTRCNKVPY